MGISACGATGASGDVEPHGRDAWREDIVTVSPPHVRLVRAPLRCMSAGFRSPAASGYSASWHACVTVAAGQPGANRGAGGERVGAVCVCIWGEIEAMGLL